MASKVDRKGKSIGIEQLCQYLTWNKNISTLNLAKNSINNELLEYILDVLKDNENLKILDLSMNRFDSLIIPDLCAIIESTRIRTLILKDNNLGKKGAMKISKTFFQETSKSKSPLTIDILEKLDLS